MQLRSATSDLSGEEKFDAMKEKADQVYEALAEAIDECEKDITYNPREFLGVPLYPDSIYGWASTLFGLGLALFQSNYAKM